MPLRPPVIPVLLLLLLGVPASAHHNPEETIAALTAEISRDGGSADLYYKRATEYRQLRRDAEAEADFRQVAALRPDDPGPYRSLAQILLWQEKLRPARVEALHAIARTDDPRLRASCRILLSQIEQAAGHHRAALAACDLAFADCPVGEIDWYLLRADLHQSLRRDDLRIDGLRAGHDATGSIVLRNAWIDARLDAGHPAPVLPLIEQELASSRLKSSWLLRRARARLLLGQTADAHADLSRALAEIDSRMPRARPHPALLIDRATALALLGRSDEARRDFLAAQSLHADPSRLRRLQGALSPASAPAD